MDLTNTIKNRSRSLGWILLALMSGLLIATSSTMCPTWDLIVIMVGATLASAYYFTREDLGEEV